jgi:hypothetical protein
MMELMQKYAKEDGAVGIDNLDRWRTCPAAIEFLCATTSANSFEELKAVCSLCFRSTTVLSNDHLSIFFFFLLTIP